jgi:hypothetical protein
MQPAHSSLQGNDPGCLEHRIGQGVHIGYPADSYLVRQLEAGQAGATGEEFYANGLQFAPFSSAS